MIVGALVRKDQEKAIYAPLVLFDLLLSGRMVGQTGKLKRKNKIPYATSYIYVFGHTGS